MLYNPFESVVAVPTLYPAGGAKQLIRVLTGKEVPGSMRSTADMGVQAHALLMAAEGAVTAYEQVIGERWKPYERAAETAGPSVDRKAADLAPACTTGMGGKRSYQLRWN